MMTRKHFEETAKILRNQLDYAETSPNAKTINAVVEDLANEFATWFNSDNPHFDRKKFMKAIFTPTLTAADL